MRISVIKVHSNEQEFAQAVNAEIDRLQKFESAMDIQIQYQSVYATGNHEGYVIFTAFITYK